MGLVRSCCPPIRRAARLEALALLIARGVFDVSRAGFVRVWINA
jgi:hypothetical protein